MVELNAESRYLVLDASTVDFQVGILERRKWKSFYKGIGDVLEHIFAEVDDCLQAVGVKLGDLDGIIYCEGPGSLLGLQLVVMGIRTWVETGGLKGKPLYTYRSLDLALAMMKRSGVKSDEALNVLMQQRKGVWVVLNKEVGLKLVEEEALKELKGEVGYLLKNAISKAPGVGQPVDYNLEAEPEIFYEEAFLREVEEADILVLEEQSFVKWSGERHMKG